MSAHDNFMVPTDLPVASIKVRSAFERLTKTEKFYAHWLSKASWEGWPINLQQTSPESPKIFKLFQKIFSLDASNSPLKERAEKLGVTSDEFKSFEQYAAQFYGNMGNYMSFGDTKFIPSLSQEKFDLCVKATGKNDEDHKEIDSIYSGCRDDIFDTEKFTNLGFPHNGNLTTYLPMDVTEAELAVVEKFLNAKGIVPYNTTLAKENGTLIIDFACQNVREEKEEEFEGHTFKLRYGLYSECMGKVADCLEKAKEYAANDNQRNMLTAYVEHFREGDIAKHKESQKHWVRDIGPIVECNIGFIESYRDPAGVRGEFEGFVAVVDKEVSKKYSDLVSRAPEFLDSLPWPKEFEKDKFLKPDFTALEIISFCSGGIPIGINIPNYDDIRQNFGFKNVSLQNIIAARQASSGQTFFSSEDEALVKKYKIPALSVQVAGHELLGHGSGKMLHEDSNGKKDFDASLLDPLSNSPVKSWYKPGETYDSVFGALGSSFEECRAECVGLLLSTNEGMLKLFGYEGDNAREVMEVNWLSMVEAGVRALQFYSVEKKKWGQAHMQARFGILRTMIEAGENFLRVDMDGDKLTIALDLKNINSVGVPAINKFLQKIQIYKATANIQDAQKMFTHDITAVSGDYITMRDIVLKNKKPRHVYARVTTEIDGDDVKLCEYGENYEAVIRSISSQF